jgi:hypothetical protein
MDEYGEMHNEVWWRNEGRTSGATRCTYMVIRGSAGQYRCPAEALPDAKDCGRHVEPETEA